MRRLGKRDLGRGWQAWLDEFLERRRKQRLLAAAAGRLAKPALTAAITLALALTQTLALALALNPRPRPSPSPSPSPNPNPNPNQALTAALTQWRKGWQSEQTRMLEEGQAQLRSGQEALIKVQQP